MTLLAVVSLAGCRHKVVASPPPPPAAPPLNPTSMTPEQPLPSVPPPSGKRVGAPGSDENTEKAAVTPPPPKHVHRSKKRSVPADAVAGAPPAAPAPAPAAGAGGTAAGAGGTAAGAGGMAATPEPSLGQLSAGRSADTRESAEMNEEIRAQDVRLSAIKRPLSGESEAIVTQIRTFLAKARQAVKENDLDGARTLTLKARVLLDELSTS